MTTTSLRIRIGASVVTVRPSGADFVLEVDGVEKDRAPDWPWLWDRAMDLLERVGGRAKRFEICGGREVLVQHRFRYVAPERRKALLDG